MTDQQTFNAADEEAVKLKRHNERHSRDRVNADLRAVLNMSEGRNLVWWLLGVCKVFETSMTGNSQTFFNEGMRNVGLILLRKAVEVKPDLLFDLQREAAEILKGGYS